MKNRKSIPVIINKITEGNFVFLEKLSNKYEKTINKGSTNKIYRVSIKAILENINYKIFLLTHQFLFQTQSCGVFKTFKSLASLLLGSG